MRFKKSIGGCRDHNKKINKAFLLLYSSSSSPLPRLAHVADEDIAPSGCEVKVAGNGALTAALNYKCAQWRHARNFNPLLFTPQLFRNSTRIPRTTRWMEMQEEKNSESANFRSDKWVRALSASRRLFTLHKIECRILPLDWIFHSAITIHTVHTPPCCWEWKQDYYSARSCKMKWRQ